MNASTIIARFIEGADQPARLLVLKGDCRYWLPLIPSESIDLIITDPPYESLERHRAKGTTTRLKQSKASSNQWFETISNEDLASLIGYDAASMRLDYSLYGLLKQNRYLRMFCDDETEKVLTTGYNPYTRKMDIPPLGILADPRLWTAWPSWTWAKTKKGSGADSADELEQLDIRSGMGYHGRRASERILYLEKGKPKINDLSVPDVLVGPRAGKSDYPTQKPTRVLHPLVRCHGVEGGVLLDPFAGSGSIAPLANGVFGMRSILIDIDISWIEEHVVPRYSPHEVIALSQEA